MGRISAFGSTGVPSSGKTATRAFVFFQAPGSIYRTSLRKTAEKIREAESMDCPDARSPVGTPAADRSAGVAHRRRLSARDPDRQHVSPYATGCSRPEPTPTALLTAGNYPVESRRSVPLLRPALKRFAAAATSAVRHARRWRGAVGATVARCRRAPKGSISPQATRFECTRQQLIEGPTALGANGSRAQRDVDNGAPRLRRCSSAFRSSASSWI
jgi:hypothetical protein